VAGSLCSDSSCYNYEELTRLNSFKQRSDNGYIIRSITGTRAEIGVDTRRKIRFPTWFGTKRKRRCSKHVHECDLNRDDRKELENSRGESG